MDVLEVSIKVNEVLRKLAPAVSRSRESVTDCVGIECDDCPFNKQGEFCRLSDYQSVLDNPKRFDQKIRIIEDICDSFNKVDWSKVEKDAKVYVLRGGEWEPRHFSKYNNGAVYVFCDGRDSFTENVDSPYESSKVKLAEE